mmetsp:Transcript_25887/g.48592  ORF Transcript_25887/g.48592 Transcript_25887/m.48592 type:complete len:80 (+) Transcript_25887:116-355(+)
MDLGDDLVESFSLGDNDVSSNISPLDSARQKYPSHLMDNSNQKRWMTEGVMESFTSMDYASSSRISQQSPYGSPRSIHK